MSNRRRPERDPNVLIDPRRAVLLDEAAGRRERAQDIARQLLRENADLLKTLGMVLERTGPIVLTRKDLEDAGRLYEIERYESNDLLEVRFVAKRVAG